MSATQDRQMDGGGDGAAEWVFDRIVDYDKEGGLFRVRREGYAAEHDTWEPPDHLPRNAVVRFFRMVKSHPPDGIINFANRTVWERSRVGKDEESFVQEGIISADMGHGIQVPQGIGKGKRKNFLL